MGYNNYNNNRGRYDNGRGYSGGGYSNRNQYSGGNGQQRQQKKHSGAKYHASSKNGNPCIVAWNYSRATGLVKVFIAPYSGTGEHESKNGKTYQNWMCKIEGKKIAPQHFPVLVNTANNKAVIDTNGWGWVVNPSAPNGGYCGSFKKR